MIVFDEEQLDVATDGEGNNGVADIFQFEGSVSAGMAIADHVGIHVATTGTLDGTRVIGFGHHQGLDFSHLQGAKDAAQTCHPAAMAARVTQDFPYQLLTLIVLCFPEYA